MCNAMSEMSALTAACLLESGCRHMTNDRAVKAKSRVNQGAYGWVLDASTSFQPDAAGKSELIIWILSDNVVKRKRSQVCLEPAAFSRRLAAAQSFQRSSRKQRMTSPVCAHAHQCQRAPVTVAIPALSSNLRGCFALPQANTKTLNARGRQLLATLHRGPFPDILHT